MYLTREEERILDGEEGEAESLALRVLVKVGEALGAERLVPVVHAHASGISYSNIGEPGLRFIERLARMGGKVRVYATVNPIGMDSEYWPSMGVDSGFAEKQLRVLRALRDMGFELALTCTPYYLRRPKLGEHLAWGESSAVAYANTVYGARTNREGGPLALMAALVGRTYLAGMHLDENRRPTLLVDASWAGVGSATEAGLLGGLLGELVGEGVPYIVGVPRWREVWVKELCAAAGALGSLAMCLIEGVSPEAPKFRAELSGLERVQVEPRDLESVKEKLSGGGEPDLLYLGCPHASLEELRELARLLEGRGRVRREFWVSVSRRVFLEALREGLVEKLRSHGIKVWKDTCPVVAPLRGAGFRTVGTNSVKTAFYMPRMHGIGALVMGLEEMVEYAFRE